MRNKEKHTTFMTREELFNKVQKANGVAWLADVSIQKFYVGLAKASIFIIPFMLFAIVINGGIIFDIIMICLYISMFLQMGLQAPYDELKAYSYRFFGSDEPLKNTLKSIELISKTEKEIKSTTSKENEEEIYQSMVDELDKIYGKNNHLFLSSVELNRKMEKAQQDKNIEEAREKYLNKIKEVNQEAERKAKETLAQWFAPVVEEYDKLIQMVKKQEALQFDVEGNKEERDTRKEENAKRIESQVAIVQQMLNDVRNKYAIMSKDIDTSDELNVETCLVNTIYKIGFKADGDQETNGLCTLLAIIIDQDMINYPQYRHGRVMIAMKRSYEILQSLGLYHPDVDRERYQGYCIYANQKRIEENSKEYKEAKEKQRKEEQKKKWKEWEKEEKARKKAVEKRIKPIVKDLERWKKRQREIELRRYPK